MTRDDSRCGVESESDFIVRFVIPLNAQKVRWGHPVAIFLQFERVGFTLAFGLCKVVGKGTPLLSLSPLSVPFAGEKRRVHVAAVACHGASSSRAALGYSQEATGKTRRMIV